MQRGGRYNVYTTNIPDTRPPFGSLSVSQHAGLISLSRQHVTKVFLNLSNYAAGDSWASFLWSRKLTGSGCTVSGYRGVGGVGVGGYGENADLWLKQRVRLINSEQKLRTKKTKNQEQKRKTKKPTEWGGKNEHNQQKKICGDLSKQHDETRILNLLDSSTPSASLFFSLRTINETKLTTQISTLLLCVLYLFVELMITINE